MGKRPCGQLILGAALFLATTLGHATVLTYDAHDLGGSVWQLDYTLTNDTLNVPLEEFTIFFDRNVFTNLSFSAAPDGWDPLIVQPDLQLPDDGFFDALSLSGGLALGESLSGFSVTARWLGAGMPAPQLWAVVDPFSFITLESGLTIQESPPTSVPEPGSLALFAIGALGVAILRRRRETI